MMSGGVRKVRFPGKARQSGSRLYGRGGICRDRVGAVRRKLTIWISAGVGLAALLILLVLTITSTKARLKALSQRVDPAQMQLKPGWAPYVRYAVLDDLTEVGIIKARNGSYSRYWFRSHHLTGDDGGAWFAMSDGTRVYMSGYFCCDVQFGAVEAIEDLEHLKQLIRKHDGTPP